MDALAVTGLPSHWLSRLRENGCVSFAGFQTALPNSVREPGRARSICAFGVWQAPSTCLRVPLNHYVRAIRQFIFFVSGGLVLRWDSRPLSAWFSSTSPCC